MGKKSHLFHAAAHHARSEYGPGSFGMPSAQRVIPAQPFQRTSAPTLHARHIGGALDRRMSPLLRQSRRVELAPGQAGYLDDLTSQTGQMDSDMAFASQAHLLAAVVVDLNDSRQRQRSAEVWMAAKGSDTEQIAADAENTFVETMESVDHALKEGIENDSNWCNWFVKLAMPLSRLPQPKNSIRAPLRVKAILGVKGDILSVVNQLSFFEKVRLTFKVIREVFTWVVVQKAVRRKLAAIQLLMRYFFGKTDRFGMTEEKVLFAGSTSEEQAMFRDLDKGLKDTGADIFTEIAPRLEELAALDWQQSAPAQLAWLAEQIPTRREELLKAQQWLESKGINIFGDSRIARAEPDVLLTLELIEEAKFLHGLEEEEHNFVKAVSEEEKKLVKAVREFLPKVESLNVPHRIATDDGLGGDVNLVQALTSSLQTWMPPWAQRPTHRF